MRADGVLMNRCSIGRMVAVVPVADFSQNRAGGLSARKHL